MYNIFTRIKKTTRFLVTTPLSCKVEGHILKCVLKKILKYSEIWHCTWYKSFQMVMVKNCGKWFKKYEWIKYFFHLLITILIPVDFTGLLILERYVNEEFCFSIYHSQLSFCQTYCTSVVEHRPSSVVRLLSIQDKVLSFFLHSSCPLITSCLT